jgi:predicted nuclease of predicted toxin-antitoxin system
VNILVDMNLSPAWVKALARHGHRANHWSTIGDPGAPDAVLFAWARAHRHIIFTNDLDFGRMLALSRGTGPSVIQFRAQDVLPSRLEADLLRVLEQFAGPLTEGALVTVDERRARVRLLPLVP